jgi:hypothetical protein
MKAMESGVYVLGIVLTVVGISLGLWKAKRKFDRTNAHGVEQFRSFGGKMIATTFDDLLYWAAIASLFVGLFILAFS